MLQSTNPLTTNGTATPALRLYRGLDRPRFTTPQVLSKAEHSLIDDVHLNKLNLPPTSQGRSHETDYVVIGSGIGVRMGLSWSLWLLFQRLLRGA